MFLIAIDLWLKSVVIKKKNNKNKSRWKKIQVKIDEYHISLHYKNELYVCVHVCFIDTKTVQLIFSNLGRHIWFTSSREKKQEEKFFSVLII